MTVCAVLVWYDEPPELLRETVASWGQLCGRLIAVDGRIEGYPGEAVTSPREQSEAIIDAARESEMQWSVIEGRHLYRDHAEKRSRALRAATNCTGCDWLFLPDADEELLAPPEDIHERLEQTTLHAGEVLVEFAGEKNGVRLTVQEPQRRLLRRLPGLRVGPYHYRYTDGRGRVLWDHPDLPQIPSFDTGLRISHRRDERPPERNEAARTFYRQRREPEPSLG